MDLAHVYTMSYITRVLEKYLLGSSSRDYPRLFGEAKKELFKRKMCESVSLNVRDTNTMLIVVQSRGKRNVLSWDMLKNAITYERRGSNVTS